MIIEVTCVSLSYNPNSNNNNNNNNFFFFFFFFCRLKKGKFLCTSTSKISITVRSREVLLDPSLFVDHYL